MNPALLVIAKDPRPGRSKTRLCPPCTPEQAAALAEAALRDTLEVVLSVPAGRHLLVLEGASERWARPGLEIIPQRGAGLDERLEHAFADLDGPGLLVGMDTPQLAPALLEDGLAALATHDAVLGPASDGGYWAVGLARPVPGGFTGVPMSAPDTGARQRERFDDLRLSVAGLPELRDVDTMPDAHAAAAAAPASRFAATLAGLALPDLERAA